MQENYGQIFEDLNRELTSGIKPIGKVLDEHGLKIDFRIREEFIKYASKKIEIEEERKTAINDGLNQVSKKYRKESSFKILKDLTTVSIGALIGGSIGYLTNDSPVKGGFFGATASVLMEYKFSPVEKFLLKPKLRKVEERISDHYDSLSSEIEKYATINLANIGRVRRVNGMKVNLEKITTE